jgi:hypothetical protein
MVFKKVLYGVFGLVLGFAAANAVFIPVLRAESGSAFNEKAMDGRVPAKYGKLVTISGTSFYFQGDDGTVYILKQRTNNEFSSDVTVIKRGH